MNRLGMLLGLAGFALATGLIIQQGAGVIVAALASAGLGIVWASLFHFVPMTLNARGWRVLLPGARPPSVAFFTWLVWLREAVNGLLPVARIGGEVVSTRQMVKWGIRASPAVASVVVDTTVGIVTQFLLTLLGMALLAAQHASGWRALWSIALSVAIVVPIVVIMLVIQRIGLFALMERFVRAIVGDRWTRLAGSAARLDRAIRQCYRRRRRVLASAAWQLAGGVSGAGEVWLALHFLGHPTSLVDAFLIEALVSAIGIAAFVVPGALGVQEGAFLVIGGLLGIPAPVALALALVRRARDFMLFLPAVIAWQALEGRRLLLQR